MLYQKDSDAVKREGDFEEKVEESVAHHGSKMKQILGAFVVPF